MLNLNLNTISSKLSEQPRGIFSPRFSASFFLYGGGGNGGPAVDTVNPTVGAIGGGGGAGMVVSGSISFVPYLEYTTTIGTGSQSISGSAGFSQMEGYDFNETRPIKAYAAGGKNGEEQGVGGDSGDGYYQTPEGTASYSAYIGGTRTLVNLAGDLYCAAGGGAGSAMNGVNGTASQTPSANISGGGGSGSLATIETYDPSVAAPGPFGQILSGSIGAAGGGTGGGPGQNGLAFGEVGPRGFYGGGTSVPDEAGIGTNAFSYGAGGAGASISATSVAGKGYEGTLIITYCGEPKLDIINGTTSFDGTNTVHIFNTGSGTFVYANHYLNIPVCAN